VVAAGLATNVETQASVHTLVSHGLTRARTDTTMFVTENTATHASGHTAVRQDPTQPVRRT
jgi:hypothetical protein